MAKIDDIGKFVGSAWSKVDDVAKSAIKKAGPLSGAVTHGLNNIKSVGAAGEYVEAAITGALTWGAVGGVTEWAQGGSFVGGVKQNLVSGALMGAGGRAIKVGGTGHDWSNAGMGDVVKGYSAGVSKQVEALQNLNQNVTKTKAATTLKGRYKPNNADLFKSAPNLRYIQNTARVIDESKPRTFASGQKFRPSKAIKPSSMTPNPVSMGTTSSGKQMTSYVTPNSQIQSLNSELGPLLARNGNIKNAKSNSIYKEYVRNKKRINEIKGSLDAIKSRRT